MQRSLQRLGFEAAAFTGGIVLVERRFEIAIILSQAGLSHPAGDAGLTTRLRVRLPAGLSPGFALRHPSRNGTLNVPLRRVSLMRDRAHDTAANLLRRDLTATVLLRDLADAEPRAPVRTHLVVGKMQRLHQANCQITRASVAAHMGAMMQQPTMTPRMSASGLLGAAVPQDLGAADEQRLGVGDGERGGRPGSAADVAHADLQATVNEGDPHLIAEQCRLCMAECIVAERHQNASPEPERL